MRRVNKKIIMLSIILSTVFLSSSSIYAVSTSTANMRRGYISKNQDLMQEGKSSIENSFKNNDYNLFIQTIKKLNINDSISKEQFSVLVNAYNLFKNQKPAEAVKLLQDNKINPVLIRLINNRPDLTDAQKETLKKASDLIKQGKVDEARALISSAGIPSLPKVMDKKINKVENKVIKSNKEELKKAFDKARELRKQGKIDEAKKVLKDAGVPDQIQDKVNVSSTTKSNLKNNTGFFQSIKNLFIK